MKMVLDCKEYEDKIRPGYPIQTCNGVQYVFEFQNGYGASVVKFPGTYGYGHDLWELAVLRFDPDDHTWETTYNTPVTYDVEGYLTDKNVCMLLQRIEKLESLIKE